MNKWIKNGVAGFVISAAAMTAQANEGATSNEAMQKMIDSVLVDASDLIAKKLKDRMIPVGPSEQSEIDQILIDASDLIAKKLKDRMLTSK